MGRDEYSAARRNELRDKGRCINGEHHEEPQIDPRTGRRRIRCEWCRCVHAVGVVRALELAEESDMPQHPQGARYAFRRAS